MPTVSIGWNRRPPRSSNALRAAVVLGLAFTASFCCADGRLADLPPFDQLTLDKANDSAVLNVAPLELPGRRVPEVRAGSLSIRLLDDPGRTFEVSWENIIQIRFFEEMLLAEAKRLTAEKKFDEAYDYYARLLSEYPSLLGLSDAVNDYLRRNALELYQSQQLERALAVLASLYERAPDSPGLPSAVDAVCGRMIEQHLRRQDYAAARAVLETWQNEFSAHSSASAGTWEQRFSLAARRQIVEAKESVAQGDFIAARKSIGRARDIWPQSREAAELLAQIQRQNPSISVGVLEATPRLLTTPDRIGRPARPIDNWAALRTSRLVEPMLAELVGFSAEGGVYQSPFGQWIADDDGLRLSLKLAPPPNGMEAQWPSPDYLARFLLRSATRGMPEYQPDLAALLAAVSVEGNDTVHVDWLRPHVRPEALVQLPLTNPAVDVRGRPSTVPFAAPRFSATDAEHRSLVFTAAERAEAPRPGVPMIIEQTLPDDDAAVTALLRGEIDVLDRVPPWHVERLRAAPGIRVDTYRLPSVHVLIPNPSKPLPAVREFRRALCFGIERERLLRQVILGGAELPGYEVLSGPFPAGMSYSDPLRYAYNNQLTPRPFEPRLAAVLATVAWSSVVDAQGKQNEALPDLPTLVLAHPADSIARIACESIKLQLGRAGISIELLELTADDLLAGNVEFDFRYAELAVWEPLVDARRLVGPGGLAGDTGSSYLYATLRQLDEATNWREVRAKLAEIHDIAYHDLPLIPLWQTVNYFAYRTAVRGIGASPVTLYQNVDQWEIVETDLASSPGNP